jgi:hypothetical protein
VHQCMMNVPPVELAPALCLEMPMHSAHALMYGRCTIGRVGSYTGLGITKSSMHLAHALVYGRCTIGRVGSYIEFGITKSPMQLAHALMYG